MSARLDRATALAVNDGWTAFFEACHHLPMTDDPEVPGSLLSPCRLLPPWSIDAGSPDHLVLHLLIQAYARGHDEGRSEGGLPPVIHLPTSKVLREQGLTSIVGLLRAELASGSREHERAAQALLDPLLACTLRCWREARTGERDSQSSLPLDARLSRALAAMQAEPARPWTVEALAREAGLSRAAFARRFLAELGVPPLRYLAEHRMQIASRLLVEGDDSLAGVAAQIGYESEFAFSRAFRRHHGEAPGAFRRRMRACPTALQRTPTRAVA